MNDEPQKSIKKQRKEDRRAKKEAVTVNQLSVTLATGDPLYMNDDLQQNIKKNNKAAKKAQEVEPLDQTSVPSATEDMKVSTVSLVAYNPFH